MKQAITTTQLTQFEQDFFKERANRVAQGAITANGLKKSCQNPSVIQKNNHEFSISLKQGSITSQKQSGRCWLFAAMNVMRSRVMENLKLEDFELSQNYMLFWDKLEKCNWFFENILDTLAEPIGSRLLNHLLSAPINDGGQWDMMANLVRKYGVVPKYAMPETAVSSNTREMNQVMTELLRNDACQLREAAKNGTDQAGLLQMKETMLNDIYRILCICLGEPPKTFDFEVRDRNGQFIQARRITPVEFFCTYVDMELSDYVSLINAPTNDKPFYRCYTVDRLGNVQEGAPICYINLPMEELKAATIAQLSDGEPVWFGCDMGPRVGRDSGVMDLELYDFEDVFQVQFPMTKAQRLDYCQSQMTHAMVFQGVNLNEDGTSNRWRVENSWGDEPGKKGYFVMSDAWFSQYMYQVVIHKKYLTRKQLQVLETEPITLNPWDPMGSLAVIR